MTVSADRPLRSDAAANRERIISAACDAFAEHGRDASVEDIARRAGVGVGTLYRRFPTKTALAEELATILVEHVHAIAVAALSDRPPGQAFEAYVLELCGLRSRFGRALVWLYGLDAVAGRIADLTPLMQQMIAEGKAGGRLRGDLDENDLGLLLWSVQGIVEATRDVAPDAWRRQVEIVFAGWRATGAPALLTPPVDGGQLERIKAAQRRT